MTIDTTPIVQRVASMLAEGADAEKAAFVDEHRDRFSGLPIREATKRLD